MAEKRQVTGCPHKGFRQAETPKGYRYYCEDCGADSGVTYQVAQQGLRAFEDDVKAKKRAEAKATATDMKAKGLL